MMSRFKDQLLYERSLAGLVYTKYSSARSAPPVSVFDSLLQSGTLLNANTQIRPDLIAGIPFTYLVRSIPVEELSTTLRVQLSRVPRRLAECRSFCPPPTDASGNRLGKVIWAKCTSGFRATQWILPCIRLFYSRVAKVAIPGRNVQYSEPS